MTLVSWNSEGLRTKVQELTGWLPAIKADVVAIQEAQLPKTVPSIPGYQPPVVVRRARGRRTGAGTKGGDVVLYVRSGLHFIPLTDRLRATADDTTEICGVRLLGPQTLDVINIYRPPISWSGDDREDHFDPGCLPNNSNTILLGDINGHHPRWDGACDTADAVGERVADWMEQVGWATLNSGEPTFASYRTGAQSAPDLAACAASLSRRATWRLGPDLGSDHLPMVVEIRAETAPPRRIRKSKWAYHKADWVAFKEEVERALAEPPDQDATTQKLADRFEEAMRSAAVRHIPRGARADPRPWALDPEVQEAVQERRAARADLREGDNPSRERWIAAKRRAADVERRVAQEHFREFVSSTLNRPANVGKVHKILKKWEHCSDDEFRDGQAMVKEGKLLSTDRAKAEAFAQEYARVSRQVRVAKIDRAAKQKMALPEMRSCQECEGRRCGACSPFRMEELVKEISRTKMKKSPGPDSLSNEMLVHLGPVARETLLSIINCSWRTGEVPRQWRQATVIPIPKAGKDKKLVASYRPIALTSHIGKLMERLIKCRLTYLAESRGLIPPEQVGFRAGRAVEDNLGRLLQEVQDGWQRPKRRSRNQEASSTAQKFVLVAFDFARAYDVVDHRLLRLRLLELGLPRCFVQWTWQWLRDRRVRVEVNGTKSNERVFRAGLPQGSVLSPLLFVLWAAPLVSALKTVPGCSPYMYADDTATLCAGADIETARRRAQQAADALVKWAKSSKMVVSGGKTQVLVLSQWYRDAVDLSIWVDGARVTAGETLNLLGVSLDRLLNFGPHCRRLRSRTRPRLEHLRRLTGRNWGLEEQHLRTVANGYIRGALEHAAAAWIPATSPSHAEVLERELREAARIITGCTRSTPVHALMAEAGLAPVSARRTTLAARFLAKARALPEEDPLRRVSDANVQPRLSSVTGWRTVGLEAWREAGVVAPIEPTPPPGIPPWTEVASVKFDLSAGPALPAGASEETRRQAAAHHLSSLPQCATWVWSDGSATGGVLDGGAGVFIEWPDGETKELRAPAGRLCSSYRAELVALREALNYLLDHPAHTEDPLVVCTDSQSALAALRSGPAEQVAQLNRAVWDALIRLSEDGTRQIRLQWVPSHCGLDGNEKADTLAKEAAALPQEEVPVDSRTVHRAAARAASKRTIEQRPQGWFRSLMGEARPSAVTGLDRHAAIDVHQLRAGHWSASQQYLHRIGRNPTPDCERCEDVRCRGGLCPLCREEADTPQHVLLRCPALMQHRFRLTGNIHCPTREQARRSSYVAAMAAAFRRLQGREASQQ